MGVRKCLNKQECIKIISLKNDGLSIHAIGRELNRSRLLITKFIRNPEEYIKKNTSLDKEILIKNDNKNGTTTATPKKISTSKLITSTSTNKKVIRTKSYGSAKKFSDDEIKRFNRVTVEHRAVIKYLIKKGIGPRFIYDDIKKVYGNIAPDLQSILYWAKQFQQGRQTIFNNEPANKQQKINSTNSNKSNSNNKITTLSSTSTKSPAKQVQLFKFKFKPLKRLNK